MTNRPTRYPPLGLRHDEAALYIGVGTTKFDEMVGNGRMPQPRCVDSCRIWDRAELEQAFARLPHKNVVNDNPWDDV